MKSSALHPPPEYRIPQESYRGGLIETSGKMPTRNPADQVHYIVRFRDWRLAHSVTFALDVPKIGTIGSGELESRQTSLGISAFLPLSGPIRNPVSLDREYRNRPAEPAPIDIFASEQNNSNQLECV